MVRSQDGCWNTRMVCAISETSQKRARNEPEWQKRGRNEAETRYRVAPGWCVRQDDESEWCMASCLDLALRRLAIGEC